MALPRLIGGASSSIHSLSAFDRAESPRAPQPGAPYTYVTTQAFLLEFGLETLRDLPDREALEDAGLLSKEHFSADGTLIQAWASHKSFAPKDGGSD